MKLSPALSAELVELISERTRRARVTLTGTSMQPLLCAGMVVDIEPLVQVGETVTPETVLGTIYVGPDGIETGWADNGTGDTMARDAGEFYGWNSTAFGANYSQLLVSLGAPGGVPQNEPPTGVLPPDWPTW